MNTQACARTRANTPAHALMRTHPRYGGACTRVHAARKHMHAGIRTMHMHVYARARANTPAHVHALVQTHAHIFWLRAKRIGAVLLSYELCLGRPYLSLAVWPCLCCFAWPRLRRQRWWLRLDDLGRRFAGRAMPCIKLLLPRTKLRSENRVSLHVSIPERMVSCRLSLVHVRKRWACHRPLWVQ